jgi:hypothetical protein
MVQKVNLHPLKSSNLCDFLFFYCFSRTHVSRCLVVFLIILEFFFLWSDVLASERAFSISMVLCV